MKKIKQGKNCFLRVKINSFCCELKFYLNLNFFFQIEIVITVDSDSPGDNFKKKEKINIENKKNYSNKC